MMNTNGLEAEPIDDMAYYQLRFTQKLQLAWSIGWPCLLFDVMTRPFRSYLGDSPWKSEVENGLLLFSFLVFGPWVIRQVVRLNFADFHLAVIRHGSLKYVREMNYRESLSVLWLITWRPIVVAIPYVVFFGLIAAFTGTPLDAFGHG